MENQSKLKEFSPKTFFLGRNIHFLRKQRGISQTELGETIGKGKGAISHWERGEGYPEVDSILRISTLFDISLDALFFRDMKSEKQESKKYESEDPKEVQSEEDQNKYPVITEDDLYNVKKLSHLLLDLQFRVDNIEKKLKRKEEQDQEREVD